MDEIEVGLGVTVLLLSVFSILFINFGVVPSPDFPGHYTYGDLASHSGWLSYLILIAGFVAIVQGVFKKRVLEFVLGFIVLLWQLGAMFWLSLSFYDATSPYIKSFPMSVTWDCLSMVPGIVLGIILVLDGIRRKTLPQTKNNLSESQ